MVKKSIFLYTLGLSGKTSTLKYTLAMTDIPDWQLWLIVMTKSLIGKTSSSDF